VSKLHLTFFDRIGVVADISSALARHGVNIPTMEVVLKEGCAHVYLDLEPRGGQDRHEDLLAMLAGLADLREIRFVEALPH
jgi:transcriptional regulator of aroF, aroG, tyrA and aromatic amino acid transport